MIEIIIFWPLVYVKFQILYFQGFWKYLLQRNLGQHWLDGIYYAVFGLGDSGYQKFNVMLSLCLFSLALFFEKVMLFGLLICSCKRL